MLYNHYIELQLQAFTLYRASIRVHRFAVLLQHEPLICAGKSLTIVRTREPTPAMPVQCSNLYDFSVIKRHIINDEGSCLHGGHVGDRAMSLHVLQLLQTPFQLFQRLHSESALLVFYIQRK